MKYRIVREKEICFMVYYPQFSRNGKQWEMWYQWKDDMRLPQYFYTKEAAQQFIKHQQLIGDGPEVVWESEA